MSMETHVIKDIKPGVFYTLLASPYPCIVLELLSDSFPWVLRLGHMPTSYQWEEFSLPVGKVGNRNGFTQKLEYDLLVETSVFRELYSDSHSVQSV